MSGYLTRGLGATLIIRKITSDLLDLANNDGVQMGGVLGVAKEI